MTEEKKKRIEEKKEKKQQLAERRERAKIKRAKRSYRLRGLKNFFIWFLGVFCGLIIIVSIVAIGTCIIPIKNYLDMAGVQNREEYVSEEVANKTVVKAIMDMGTYEISDIAFVANMLDELITQSGMDQILKIDVAKLKTVKLSNLGNGLMSCVKLSKQLFGDDFSQLEIFKTMEVPEKDMPTNPLSAGSSAKLYYYLKSGVYGESSAVYERAYNDDGTRVVESLGKTIYYLDITEMTMEDIIDVIGPRFKLMGIKSILEIFGGAEETSMIVKVLGDRNIGEIGSLSAADIKLCDVVEVTDESVKNILSDVTGGKAFEEITVADFADINTDNIKMSNVLGTINDDLRSMLEEATGVSYEDMTLRDVKNVDDDAIKNIRLSSVINLDPENGLYRIITSLFGNYDEVTLEDLTDIELGDILLKDVFDLSEDMKQILTDMLVDGVEIASYDEIKLSAFEGIDNGDISRIKLSSVLEISDAQELYDILEDLTGIASGSITIGNLVSFDVGNLKLSTIIDITDNNKLYEILVDAVGGGKTAEEISVSDLISADFNIENIRLSSVIDGTSGNRIIDKLIEDDTVTIGNIGEKANALKLADIISVDVMEEVAVTASYSSDEAIYTSADGVTYELVEGAFNVSTKKYTYTGLDTSKTYYKINSEAGVWFIALTETEDSVGYGATDAEWGAYKTIIFTEGCALGELSSMQIDVSFIKMKVLKDLGLLSANINGMAYDATLANLLG